jgi:hypothetical protein
MTVIAHVGGVPIEETLGMYGPALLLALGAASARVGAHLRRVRSRRCERASPSPKERGRGAALSD